MSDFYITNDFEDRDQFYADRDFYERNYGWDCDWDCDEDDYEEEDDDAW